MSRKKYSVEFKKMIVELYQSGTPVSDLQSEHGLAAPTIYQWIDLYEKDQESETSKADLLAIKKELARVKSENDILKKALPIFSQK